MTEPTKTISVEELRTRKIFLAVPMYGGVCHGQFARSLSDLTALCTQYGVQLNQYFLFNESLITRARNYCVDEFLRSDCTHLMFIDSDIGFNANDVITLAALQSDDSDYDVLGAVYPKKCISWEKIREGVNRGFADRNPNDLEQLVGDFVFNPLVEPGRDSRIDLSKPCEVLETGTGFMMIKRSAFEKFDKANPDIQYTPDHVRTEHFDGTRQIGMYFQAAIDPKSNRYLSEDYWFCQKLRDAGGKIYVCPWMTLAHAGTYVFTGSLAAMAAVNVSPTADPEALKATKKKK